MHYQPPTPHSDQWNSLEFATSADRQFLSISSCCVVYISLQPKTGLIWLGLCLAAFWSSSSVVIHLSFSVSFSVRIKTSLRTPIQAGWLQEICVCVCERERERETVLHEIRWVYLPLPIPNLRGNCPIACSSNPNPSKRQSHLGTCRYIPSL